MGPPGYPCTGTCPGPENGALWYSELFEEWLLAESALARANLESQKQPLAMI